MRRQQVDDRAGGSGRRRFRARFGIRTMVIGGDKDSVFSVAEQTALAGEYRNAQLTIVPGVGHFAQ